MCASMLTLIIGLAGSVSEAPPDEGIAPVPAVTRQRPNFLVIDIDTPSTPRIDVHRDGASITPVLDRPGREGLAYTRAFWGKTLPSYMSETVSGSFAHSHVLKDEDEVRLQTGEVIRWL